MQRAAWARRSSCMQFLNHAHASPCAINIVEPQRAVSGASRFVQRALQQRKHYMCTMDCNTPPWARTRASTLSRARDWGCARAPQT